MISPPAPLSATWDLTYACQLRCGYCYSESGRRASTKLPLPDLLRIADVLASMGLRAVQLSGGEPLLVEGLPEIVRRLRAGGAKIVLFTNGLLLNDDNALEMARLFARIHVSLDGATADVHDSVRGRAGSFDGARGALGRHPLPCPRRGFHGGAAPHLSHRRSHRRRAGARRPGAPSDARRPGGLRRRAPGCRAGGKLASAERRVAD